MSSLQRKLARDAWHYRGQLSAIALVTLCGVAVFVSLRSMHGFLRDSRDQYYVNYRFPDVFAPLKRAPAGVADQAARIPGVRAVSARTVLNVTLDVPGLTEPATGRLVSIPVPRASTLNELHLVSGRWPSVASPREALASAAFSEANGLQAGDSVGAVIAGRWQRLYLTGIASSPEYIYEIGGAAIFPDNRRFGVLWLGTEALQAASGMQAAFNDLTVTTDAGSETAVIAELDELLAQYGGVGAYGRDRHVSNQFVDGEIEETQVTSIVLPAIFLGVTAFLLHLVLGRLVAVQREQIGALKAFGYGNSKIGLHFLQLATIPLLAGSALGAIVGTWFAQELAVVYMRFFQFPPTRFVVDWGVVGAGAAIGCAAGLLGAAGAVRRTVSLPPAEAMRPEAPQRFHRGALERLPAVGRIGPAARITLRNLERHPLRTLSSAGALSLAIAVVVTTGGMFDSINWIKHIQFDAASREDITVTFREATSAAALTELRRIHGVTDVEGFRAVPVRLSHRNHVQYTALRTAEGRLRRIVDQRAVEHEAPASGVLLSTALAELLHVAAGDRITVQTLEGKRATREVRVSGSVDELIGTSAYMRADEMERTLGESGVVTGAYLKVPPALMGATLVELKRLPAINGVAVREAELRGFEDTIAESFTISLLTALGFACVIAFAVAYNGARVALSERGRELASLRVLGFSRREVTSMLFGEQGILLLLAIPGGLALGYAFTWLIGARIDSELFRLPVVLHPLTYVLGAGLVAAFVALSGLAILGRVRNLDMVAVLKTRE